ncbi:MAG: hypothetical protein JNM79_08265 [Burkholderiales bacterium]|nr:hypothetical protein [Burkholderiales bacterium]
MLHSEFLLNQRPGVADARGAKAWLRDLPLTDSRAAHHAISSLLSEFEHAPLTALARLEILETLRGPVAQIDADYATRYAAKALPLGLAERNALVHAQALWRALARTYLDCFEAGLGGAAGVAPHRALCLARAGEYLCAGLVGRLRAGQEEDADLFDDLQRLTDLAAEHGCLDAPVRDSLHAQGATSVAAIFRRALLLHMAGSLIGTREGGSVAALAAAWEGKVAVTTMSLGAGRVGLPAATPAMASEGAAAAAVAPAGDGARVLRVVRAGSRAHVLDLTRIVKSLRRRLRKLRHGATVAELRLPAGFSAAQTGHVLGQLSRLWGEDGNARAQPRRAGLAAVPYEGARGLVLAHAVGDYGAMYALIGGEAFTVNENEDPTSRRRFDELFVFQHASLARNETRRREAARAFEDWHVVDESDGGFRIRRERAGARFHLGQVIAMRLRVAGDDGPAVLAEIRWLAEPEPVAASGAAQPGRRHEPGALIAGVELLPGKPHAVAFKAAGLHAYGGAQYVPGFRLGSLHGAPALSLLLPPGWFRAGRMAEMRDAGLKYSVRLDSLVRRGVDFELVAASLSP